jgi:hypothetical protein
MVNETSFVEPLNVLANFFHKKSSDGIKILLSLRLQYVEFTYLGRRLKFLKTVYDPKTLTASAFSNIVAGTTDFRSAKNNFG